MNIAVLEAWLLAKLNVTEERGANMVEYVLILTLIALFVLLTLPIAWLLRRPLALT